MTADPLEMELVALNLMKNALEASDAAGGAGEVVVTLSEEDDRAILAVADDGGGTRETVERLNRGLGSRGLRRAARLQRAAPGRARGESDRAGARRHKPRQIERRYLP